MADGGKTGFCPSGSGISGGGGIINIKGHNLVHLDANVTSVRGGVGGCPGTAGSIQIKQTTGKKDFIYFNIFILLFARNYFDLQKCTE